MASHRHRRWARQLLRRPRGLSMPMAAAIGIAFPFADGLTARPSAKGTASAGVCPGPILPMVGRCRWPGRRQRLVFADGSGLPMALPSAKIGFGDGLSLPMSGPSAKYLCRWLSFAIGKSCGLPMAYSLAIGKPPGRRQISRFR